MSTQPPDAPVAAQPPRLLDLIRQVAHTRFGQDGPAERYVHWTRRLVLFQDKRPPRDLSARDVGRFLEHVAQTETDPLNCLEQAHAALNFRYQDVLGLDIGALPVPEPPRLFGHESLETTMIDTPVARKGPAGVTSPLDLLGEVSADDVQAARDATRRRTGS